ncbi:MAG: hypothetical protein IT343_13635 [Candidatus Melainabacteria bacterium]|nr:hypothetical protein [Candidatus Melainabacteria bacterium]
MGIGTYKSIRISGKDCRKHCFAKLVWPAAFAFLALPCAADEASVPTAREAEGLPVKYIGNEESHKFHRPSCPFARIMAYSKRVEFYYRSQAVACGHRPCRYCLPPVWRTVRGRLLMPSKQADVEEGSAAADPP